MRESGTLSEQVAPVERIHVGRKEAAELVNLGLRTVDELIRRDDIPSHKIGRRRVFVVQELRDWMRSKK